MNKFWPNKISRGSKETIYNLLIEQLQNLAFKGWKGHSGLQFANSEQVWAKIGFIAFSNARAEHS